MFTNQDKAPCQMNKLFINEGTSYTVYKPAMLRGCFLRTLPNRRRCSVYVCRQSILSFGMLQPSQTSLGLIIRYQIWNEKLEYRPWTFSVSLEQSNWPRNKWSKNNICPRSLLSRLTSLLMIKVNIPFLTMNTIAKTNSLATRRYS